ncbi:cytochrome c oxidase subunit IV [Methylacidimicrobium cyclopophantes]|uniref:Cytochrome c oxidase subunit IV n=1 Tax=Methylacidimicrobium cyclopophantes TaxID=1041766 RepID=A0A5E6MKR3_9BACT|nr:cytochrome C oxidase subunit IV family protein [Methylacidimicrobium cyclopophantes]VVM06083.1 cytochrome c oxidase subunit IV [Methylacidimicrobium cyclopophantes]
MSEEIHDPRKQIPAYIKVFGLLLLLAIINVAASYLPLGGGNIGIVLLVAGAQAILALGILMHFFTEKKTVHQLMGLAIASVVALLVIFLCCYADQLNFVR